MGSTDGFLAALLIVLAAGAAATGVASLTVARPGRPRWIPQVSLAAVHSRADALSGIVQLDITHTSTALGGGVALA